MRKSIYFIGGTISFCAGAVLLSQGSNAMTGFSVLGSMITPGSIWGLALIAGSMLSFMYGSRIKGLERIVESPKVKKNPNLMDCEQFSENLKPKDEEDMTILDTSALLSYDDTDTKKIMLGENLYVTPGVLDEIPYAPLKKLISEKATLVKPSEKYRAIARNILKQTEKPMLRELLMPYLTGEKRASRVDETKIEKKTYRLRRIIKKDDESLGEAMKDPKKTLKIMINYLDSHYSVSKTDVGVLAAAIEHASENQKHVIIGERDIDFREAKRKIDELMPEIGKYISCAEPYKQN